MINTSERCRLRDFIFFRSRRILALREAIDLVIKKKNIQVEIPAKQMDHVVTANAQTITVACYDPYAQVWSRCFQSACDSRRASMNGVHAIHIHIIGESR